MESTCQQCGKPFVPSRGYPNQRTCSRPCGQKLRAALAGGDIRRVCEVCGDQYTYTYFKQRTCGRVCGALLKNGARAAYSYVSHIELSNCRHCGAVHIASRAYAHRTHGHTVTKKTPHHCREYLRECARRRTGSLPRGSTIERECVDCGQSFTYALLASHRSTCDICNKSKARVKAKVYKKTVGGSHHRKRARHYGVDYEPVNRSKVFARDNWRCYICDCEVHMFQNEYADPWLATLDHVIPMSKGGPHTYANVKTCCFLCNSLKGDGIPVDPPAPVGSWR